MVTRRQKEIALKGFASNSAAHLPPALSILQSALSPVSLPAEVQKVKASLLSHRTNAVSVSIPQT